MNNTTIEWAERTWNPVTGCSPASEGCEHCYAERMAKRLRGRFGYPEDQPFQVTLHPNRLAEPLKLRKSSRIFVCSMGDLFHEDVPPGFIDEILEIIAYCDQHVFMLLTKRPENIQAKLYGITDDNPVRYLGDGDYLENLWLGVTAENQARADERIPVLLQTPAAVRFVSCEPLLGPVDLEAHLREPHWWCPACEAEVDPTRVTYNERHDLCGAPAEERGGIDWVTCGGEILPGARPIHPDWVRNLRDQCQMARVPFLFKQWGNWRPEHTSTTDEIMNGETTCPVCGCTESNPCEGMCHWIIDRDERDRCSRCVNIKSHEWPDGSYSYRVAKKTAGRLLDGREWNEYPEVNQ